MTEPFTETPPEPEPAPGRSPLPSPKPVTQPGVSTSTTLDGVTTVVGSTYRLQVRSEPPRAVLADLAGRIWSHLSLLAEVSRTDGDDESYEPMDGADLTVESGDRDVVITYTSRSPLWSQKVTRLRCRPEQVELEVQVTGEGWLREVRLLGGRAVRPSGAAGTFRSAIEFTTVFDPTPTEPVQVVRSAHSGVSLGVVGDASPGRLHAVFCPPPLCLALGRERPATPTALPDSPVLALSVRAPVAELTFTELGYEPLDGGFLLRLDYDGHTAVNQTFTTPTLVIRPATSALAALADHRADLVAHGLAPAGPTRPESPWWREPIFSGWGAQCARAPLPGAPATHPYHLHHLAPETVPPGVPVAADLSRADVYDELLARLVDHDVHPGTVVIDDRWQQRYGTGDPDPEHWPDLRGWIAEQHRAGRRVLLWWKAWDPSGVPAAECVRDPDGRPVAVDPGNPAYLRRLSAICRSLVSAEGLDADGIEVDFTQRAPTGRWLQAAGGADATWGIAGLHALLRTLYTATKDAKADALVIAHAPHPSFGDVCDMVRLNDVLERDPEHRLVPVADQLAFRAAVVHISMPRHLVDTDQWPMPDAAEWRRYVEAQAALGVPALYYAERIDRSSEPLGDADLALVARTWATYRSGGEVAERPL